MTRRAPSTILRISAPTLLDERAPTRAAASAGKIRNGWVDIALLLRPLVIPDVQIAFAITDARIYIEWIWHSAMRLDNSVNFTGPR